MNNLVEIVNLTKKYGTNVAVNHLTVSLVCWDPTAVVRRP